MAEGQINTEKCYNEIMEYKLPKAPKIQEKVMQPDQRKFCVVPLRAVLAKDLTLTGLKILCLLASYCNKAGFTYVSQARLANDLGVNQSAINRQIKQLETKGYIKQFGGYSTNIKGKTKRIIYDENISDREAEQIAGEPKEPFTNVEYNQLLQKNNMLRKNNKLKSEKSQHEVMQSSQSDREVIASLKSSVAEVHKRAEIDRLFRIGTPVADILHRFKT
jgi:DNA-binding Lrp family transcriptional regulator